MSPRAFLLAPTLVGLAVAGCSLGPGHDIPSIGEGLGPGTTTGTTTGSSTGTTTGATTGTTTGATTGSSTGTTTGSSTGTTTGTTTGATTGTTTGGGTLSDFVTGGLGKAGTGDGTTGNWNGYIFTLAAEAGSGDPPAAGSIITPEVLDGASLCVSGVLGASWQDWALLGWNISQEIDPVTFEGGMTNAIAPGGTGVAYNVVNNAGGALRIQIQDAPTATQSWCAEIPGGTGSGVIPWEDFKLNCWEEGGAAYDGVTPIAQVTVQASSASDTEETLFDFCVVHLSPAM